MTKLFARFTKTTKKHYKRRPLRLPTRHSSPTTASSASDTSSSSTHPSSSPSSPTRSPTASPTAPRQSIMPSSILPSFSLEDALIRSSLTHHLVTIRRHDQQGAHAFCDRVANILLVMFRHLHNRELQCAADDMDSFLQAMLLRPLKPLTAYVNAHKSHLGPSTMLSRFDDLSVFVSWYCLQDIARYCLYTIPMESILYLQFIHLSGQSYKARSRIVFVECGGTSTN